MTRHLLKLLTAFALSGVAAISMASDSGFIVDELRAVYSQLTDARRWVDSDIRANLSHRWKSAPRRLTDSGLRFAESELEALPWVTDVDLHRITRNGNFLAGFGVSGVGLLWTGESHALGFQPSGEWTDGSGDDFASFGVFGRKAVGDWGVLGANVFGDYASDSELGEFSRWSIGTDFQSELADLRGNWYSEGTGFRSRRIRNGEVFAYSPSGVDAELRLRWRGVAEWTGFAEYEKWDGRFGDSDTQDVGFGVTYRPLGDGILAGLEVDAGYFTALGETDDRLNLRLAYSRTLGGDNRATERNFGFGVQSALVEPVARQRKIEIAEATVLDPEFFDAESRVYRQRDGLFITDQRPFIMEVKSRCTLFFEYPQTNYEQKTSAELHGQAENPEQFDDLCDTINKTANIRTLDSNGNLATHRAVSGGALDNLKILIAAGVRVTATNTAGKTPLDLAQMKHKATGDSALRETLSTIAMVIRASGGECAMESGTLCAIEYDTLYGDDGYLNYVIYDHVVIPSNYKDNSIYQLHHPEYGNMTLYRRITRHNTLLTVTLEGEVRLIDGAIVKSRHFGTEQLVASNEHLPYPAFVHLVISVTTLAHPEPWTTPPIRKVAPGYTGAYFTVTAKAPSGQLGYSFGPGEQAAYRLVESSNSEIRYVSDGRTYFGHIDLIFDGDYPAYAKRAAQSSTNIEAATWYRNVIQMTTADQRLSGGYQNGAFAVSLNQAIGQHEAQIHDVHMFVNPYHYAHERQTLNFTIAVPSIPSHTSKRVGAGHLGAVVTLADDGLRNPNYSIIAHDDALTIDQTGILRLANTVSIGRKATLVAKITSPDLLGVLTVTAEVVSRCTPADVTPLIPSRNNHREYREYQKKGDLLLNAAEHGDILEICRLISQRADPNYRVGGDGGFPLSYGALNGDAEIARVLIAHDADSSFAYRYGETAMHYAARGFHFEYAQVLHQDGASTIDKRFNGDQPIHWIPDRSDKTKAQYRAFFELLLSDEDADIDATGLNQQTTLIKAAIRGNLNWAGALIDLGADINVADRNRHTPCYHARNNDDMLDVLKCPRTTENEG